MVIATDGHALRRAWSAWHGGIVARGGVEKYDVLVPRHLLPNGGRMTADEVDAAIENWNVRIMLDKQERKANGRADI